LSATRGVELRTPQAQRLESQVLSFTPDKPNDSLTTTEARLASRLAGFESFGDDPTEASRRRALRTLEDLYRGAGAGYSATASPSSLATLQGALSRDEALIEYVIPDRLSPTIDLHILLISRHDV
jgi:hypothetical protein